ncbi:uncharacterized protein [Rhodnius prolixus]|uniref:Uncharacterized protein n=1 Tax=Rhodnius neglectus TaxID=72488 RepID=A0A0P4W592_9HEMI
MGKSNKAITKCCPFCELQVAVACKSCPGCKHSFYNAKRMSLAQAVMVEGCRRRTERVKREKPNYYDASEYEKKTKKKRLERTSVELPKERGRPRVGESYKKKAIKKKKITSAGLKAVVGKESEEDEPLVLLTADKARQCSIILAELNRKFILTTFRT